MSETYFFNTHNVKTDELNAKNILIKPKSSSDEGRVNILDLFENSDYPFKVNFLNNEYIEGTYATGWFSASALSDGKVTLNGIVYSATDGEGENIAEKLADAINKDEYAPVTAESEIVEAESAIGWFKPETLTDYTIVIAGVPYTLENPDLYDIVQDFANYLNSIEDCPVTAETTGNVIDLTAKTPGAAGNEITLGYLSQPSVETWASGDTLVGGIDTTYYVNLTAKDIGDEGNTVTIGYEKLPVLSEDEDWSSGETLSGGYNGYYNCVISDGNVYLPGKTICPIARKYNLRVPGETFNGYITLQVERDPDGEIVYQYKVINDVEEEGYNIVQATEILD
jgi:hypothetical protein